VNVEYLKSVVITYLTMGANSKERHSLLPVLATLLAFSESELARVREGLKWEAWGGLLQVKEIKRYVTYTTQYSTHTSLCLMYVCHT
jgi:GRIP domain